MTEVTASSIVDVRLGTQMVGALMAGNRKIYVRLTRHFYGSPGNFSFTLPSWATGYGVIMSGGGGGGQAGDGGKNAQGYGGKGGDILAVWGKLLGTHSKVLSGTIGAGGAGGKGGSSGVFGDNGGNTSFVNHLSNVYTAAGGTGNPTSGMTAGGITTQVLPEPFPQYFNVPPGTRFTNGPGGTGNAGAGHRGGGGAGGNGGFFGSYTHGGKGGSGFVEIYVWGMPPDEMRGWETVQITLGPGTQARDQLRALLADRGLDYRTVTEIPFDIELVGTGSTNFMFNGYESLTSVPEMDTSNVTNMRYMFYNCKSLTSVPDLDTSNVTDMGSMFTGCSSLTTAPVMDTSSVTAMGVMFRDCSSLTTVPDMNTSLVRQMNYMFQYCAALTDGKVRLIGKHPEVSTVNMIDGSGLTREPFYDAAGNPI